MAQVQFFPDRHGKFRVRPSFHPRPTEGSPFGLLDLSIWVGCDRDKLGVGDMIDGLSLFFDRPDNLDALIEAAVTLRRQMTAAEKNRVKDQAHAPYLAEAMRDPAEFAHGNDGDHSGGGPVG